MSDSALKEKEADPGPRTPPTRIGRYLVLRTIGQGAMGVVYAGYDEELDRKVAVKLLHPTQLGESEVRARIIREAQALARVSVPNVVHVYEVGEFAGQLFIVMEHVNGMTMTKWQTEGGRTWQERLHMYCAAGQGLLDAHEAGLIHRDFKPDNVLIGSDGRPRVADFGLARLSNSDEPPASQTDAGTLALMAEQGDRDALHTPLTQTGMIMGTPLFMSPEQHLGQAADSRSDQFSFCVALYEALYGQQPFAGATALELGKNKLKGKLQPRPAHSKVPAPVHDALVQGLSTTAAHRFPSMRELLTALEFDPARDPLAAPGVRRWLSVIIPAFMLLSSGVRRLSHWLGLSEVSASVLGAAVLFAFFAYVAFRYRRTIRTNLFHRGSTVIGICVAGQALSFRLLGIFLGLTQPQLMTLDLAAGMTMCFVTSGMFLPKMWPTVLLCGVAALAAALRPAYAEAISSTVLPTAMGAGMYLWNRASQSRAQRAGGARGPGASRG